MGSLAALLVKLISEVGARILHDFAHRAQQSAAKSSVRRAPPAA
jgi:hypothetical protein